MTLTLESWLKAERDAGLESIRLCITPKPGMTANAVLKELLQAEQAIADGQVQTFPASKEIT